MPTAAIVPAAGRGERLGPGAPKALRLLAGEPLLVHAVRSLLAAGCLRDVAVACPPGAVDDVVSLLTPLCASAPVPARLWTVAGGADRVASVSAALTALPADVDVVLVHDAARPFPPPALVRSVEAAVRGGRDAVVPGVALADTIKRVDAAGQVLATVDRTPLRRIQTPQGFKRAVLTRAHEAAEGAAVTDDAGLCELIGVTVHVVPGSEAAFKVTGPDDLAIAEALVAAGHYGPGAAT